MKNLNPLSPENMQAAQEAGRRLRESRERLRAALDGKPIRSNIPDDALAFANEECTLAEGIGPFIRAVFTA